MKKTIKLFSIISLVVLILICSVFGVSAHELGAGFSMKMKDLNSQKGPSLHIYYGQLRNDNAPDYYYDCAIKAMKAWDGFSIVTEDGCNQIGPTNENISIKYVKSAWDSLGVSSNTLAFSWIVDTKGKVFHKLKSPSETTGKIDYTIIYMHPTGSVFRKNTTNVAVIKNRIQKTIVHEIGHAMGLGHPDNSNYNPISSRTFSIMRQGFPDMVSSGIVPQKHEKKDIENKY